MDESLPRRLWLLFYAFCKISALVVGGGYAILPVIEQEFVHRKKWIKPEDIVDVLALVQSVPGVIAINAAVFIGYRVAGPLGALAAGIGSVLPPFIAIVAIAAGLAQLRGQVWIDHAFTGVRAAVSTLILISAWKLGKQILKDRFAWTLAAAAFVAIVVVKLNAIWLIVGAALIGLLWRLARRPPATENGEAGS